VTTVLNCVRWSKAGTEAVGLANTASEHRQFHSVSAVSREVSTASSSAAATSCWDQDALSSVLCALMSPVSQLAVVVIVGK